VGNEKIDNPVEVGIASKLQGSLELRAPLNVYIKLIVDPSRGLC
jgi:hypothetical protein